MRSARRNVDGVSTVVTGIFILTAALMVASGYLIVAGKNYGLREEMVHQASLEDIRSSGHTLPIRHRGGCYELPSEAGYLGKKHHSHK